MSDLGNIPGRFNKKHLPIFHKWTIGANDIEEVSVAGEDVSDGKGDFTSGNCCFAIRRYHASCSLKNSPNMYIDIHIYIIWVYIYICKEIVETCAVYVYVYDY